MTPPDRTTPFSSFPAAAASRAFALVGYFACVAALVAALAGTWSIYRHQVVVAHWSVAMTRVEGCRLQRNDGILRGGRTSAAVQCRLAYRIGGVRYVVPVRSHFTVSGADSLAAWVAAHPSGSTLAVHFDPNEPATVSLAGTGLAGEENTAARPLRGALSFGIAGALLLLTASFFSREHELDPLETPEWDSSRYRTPPMSMGAMG